jgi:hypothetical protein
MKNLRLLKILFLASALGISNTAWAQPRVGERMPEFQLQGTDGRMYGISHSNDTVSVLFFVGNW